jgi:hypothetical protein
MDPEGAVMNPDLYREEYLAPMREGDSGVPDTPAKPSETAEARPVPLLPERYYYSRHRPYCSYDSLTLDNLTQPELVRILEESGIGRPSATTGAALRAWLEEKDSRLSEQDRRLAELGTRASELERQLASIRGGRAWKIYRALPSVTRVGRRLFALLNKVRKRA